MLVVKSGGHAAKTNIPSLADDVGGKRDDDVLAKGLEKAPSELELSVPDIVVVLVIGLSIGVVAAVRRFNPASSFRWVDDGCGGTSNMYVKLGVKKSV